MKYSLQERINALPQSGGIVDLDGAVCEIPTPLYFGKNNVHITGPGVLRAVGNISVFEEDAAWVDCSIKRLEIDGRKSLYSSVSGIHLSGFRNPILEDLLLHDFGGDGIVLNDGTSEGWQPVLNRVVSRDNGGHGADLANENAKVSDSRFEGNAHDGIYAHDVMISIVTSQFERNTNYAIRVMSGRAQIMVNRFNLNNGVDLYFYAYGSGIAQGNTFDGGGTGTAIELRSSAGAVLTGVILNANDFKNYAYGIREYNNGAGDPTKIVITSNIFDAVTTPTSLLNGVHAVDDNL